MSEASRRDIVFNVTRHSTAETRYVALYQHFIQKKEVSEIAAAMCKTPRAVSNWIQQYSEGSGVSRRARSQTYRKFSLAERTWIVNYITENPMSYLDETRAAFQAQFNKSISASSIWVIINENGLVRKVCLYTLM